MSRSARLLWSRRRTLGLITIALAAGLVLSACSGSGTKAAHGGSSSAAGTTKGTSTSPPSSGAGSSAGSASAPPSTSAGSSSRPPSSSAQPLPTPGQSIGKIPPAATAGVVFHAPFLGTLGTQAATAADESSHGVKVAMMELNWARYEPQPGQFDTGYERSLQAQLQAYQLAGMRVTLGLGLHYTPSWLAGLPNSHFVDEHGTVSSEIDFTFNSLIRQQADELLARADSALGFHNFWAVRITSGGSSELVYPSGGSYWAFGRNPQNGPQYPAGLAPNPFPGWRPGTAGLSAAQMNQWLQWYLGALANTADWQMTTVRSLGFSGYFQVLTPGVGVLPAGVTRAVSAGLPDGLLGVGADWQDVYRQLPHKKNVVAYVSSMADGSGGDGGCAAGDDAVALTSPATASWSAARWISRIADAYGLLKAGENPGYANGNRSFYVNASATGMMARTIAQAKSCHFQGVYWAHDDQLWDGTVAASRLYSLTTPAAGLPPVATP